MELRKRSRASASIWRRLVSGWLIAGGCLVWTAALTAQMIPLQITAQDIDAAACRVVAEGESLPADKDQIFTALGLQNIAHRGWHAPDVTGKRSQPCYYLLAFRETRPLGTVIVSGTVTGLAYLKADVASPPDAQRAEHWQRVALPPQRGSEYVVTLPPGVKTRAILFTDDSLAPRSALTVVRPIGARLASVTPLAAAHADAQYTAFSSAGPPFTFKPSLVVEGTGHWQNVGKNQQGQINRPPISDVYPSWFLLSWREPQELCGLYARDTAQKFELEYFVGPEGISPRAAKAGEWKPIRELQQSASDYYLMYNRTVSFPPVKTRGLRMRFLKSSDGAIAKIESLHALVNLGDAPAEQVAAAPQAAPQASFHIPVELPGDGYLTLVVNDREGRRVRNVVTRQWLSGGQQRIEWNLMNEQGVAVPAGEYRWKALYHPGLKQKYEFTVYPNIKEHAPENSPWLNEMSGAGGWMADHSPPRCAAVAGDSVFLGAPVSESGVSLIECDLAGRKRWAHPSFAGFTGAWWLAADDARVYVGAQAMNTAASWGVDPSTEAVWTVDLQTKEVRELARLEPTEARQRGIQGMAAHAGKLYLSVAAADQWLNNAASLANVDFDNCLPRHRTKRKPHFAYEVVPDPQGDFARLFRLTGTPPGGAAGNKGGLTWLTSESSGSSRAHIVLAFQEPVDLGSVVLPVPRDADYKLKLSVLKHDAPYPPDANKTAQWQDFDSHGTLPWDVAVAPPNTKTRALRITFFKGEDDLLANLSEKDDGAPNVDDVLAPKDDAKDALGFGDTRWSGRLEGMKLLRRRFANVAGDARVRVSSGRVASDGVWDAQRSTPLSVDDPGIYLLEWDQAQSLRGLALKEIDGKRTLIDVYTGPAGEIDLRGDAGWQQVAEYEQPRRDHHSGFDSYNGLARYLDGYVDFGKIVETRAVRLRVVEQWADNLPDSRGIRQDLGGTNLDPRRCRVFGVAALAYLGGETPVDTRGNQRIEVVDGESGKIVAETALPQPGAIACDARGQLFAVSGSSIVAVDLQGGKHRPVVEGLQQPAALAIDRDGNFYVFEGAASQRNVLVFNIQGKLVREIGERGGYQVGPWQPERMGNVTALAVDARDQLWVVADNYFPKRIAVWTTAGKYVKEFLGNTAYGGGGILDPYDKRRLFYGPLEFELDWQAGTSRLKNLLTEEFRFELVPVRVGEREYLVTGPEFAHQKCGIVYRYLKDRIVPAAAVGHADGYPPLAEAKLHAALGSVALKEHRFRWSDLNADGNVQAEEVTLAPLGKIGYTTDFNRDLSISAGPVLWEVERFLDSGVPIYKETNLPLDAQIVRRTAEGNFLCFGGGDREPERLLSPQGEVLWTYPSEGASTHGLTRAAPYSSGQIVGHFGWAGFERAAKGDLGEFAVLHTNTGIWHILTTDGLLAGHLFHDLRNKPKSWSMLEHERGMSLDGVTVGQEHFNGYFCRTSDGKYYAVAGHNHISLVEIEGLDAFKRLEGTLTITPQALLAAEAYAQSKQKAQQFVDAPVIDCYRLSAAPKVDGRLDDWEGDFAAEFGDRDGISQNIIEGAHFRIGYTDEHLHLAWQTVNLGPLKNSGQDWDRLFKTGAAVDLQLSTRPDAPEDRRHPVEGDLRLLLTWTGKQPRAVLYRAVVPGTKRGAAWSVVSPTGEASFDQVVELSDVQLGVEAGSNGYTLEASVPLARLGLEIVPGERLKIDWGVLQTDDSGNQVLRRLYWANKATAIIADIPSEARLHPDLWGHVLFFDRSRDKATEFLKNSTPDGKPKDDLVKELLGE